MARTWVQIKADIAVEPGDISKISLSTCKQHFTASINLSLFLLLLHPFCIFLHWSHFSIMLQLSGRSDCSERRREVRITVYIYYTLALCYPMHSLLPCQFCSMFSFEKCCVARCRHDYGLRTSLAKKIKGQISIVRQFSRCFGPI